MPREAPVTSTTSDSNMRLLPCCLERRADARRILEREQPQLRAALDAPIQSREHLAGPALDQLRDPAGGEGPHRVGPAHRARQLPYQELADVVGALVWLCID